MQKAEKDEALGFIDAATDLLASGLFPGADAAKIVMVVRYLEEMKNELFRVYDQKGKESTGTPTSEAYIIDLTQLTIVV
jgi:prolyl-tRNA synthetase